MTENFDELFEQMHGQYIDGSIVQPHTTTAGVSVYKASGYKCRRCWKILDEVGDWREFHDLCMRCVNAVLLYHSGYDMYDHAIKQWDTSYNIALSQGMEKQDAITYAGKWNQRIKPFVGNLADYNEPEII